MKTKARIALLGTLAFAAVVVAALYGVHWYRVGRFIEATENAYVEAHTIAIRSELSARVVAVHVQDNQVVQTGQPLVTLRSADLQARRAQAEAALAVAQAAIVEIESRTELQASRIEQARAEVAAAQANVRRTAHELERARKLARQEYGSQQRLQNAEADHEVAQARLAAARATLSTQRQSLAVLDAEKTSARARLRQAGAELAYAEAQLAKARIVAPHSGVVGNLSVEPGAMAQPAKTLMSLVPLPHVYVVANYKETQIAHMRVGQPATLHVDAYPDLTFHGVIESLSPATGAEFSLLPRDNATGNFNKIVQRVPVRIRVTGPTEKMHLLRPGLSVVPTVDTREPASDRLYAGGPPVTALAGRR